MLALIQHTCVCFALASNAHELVAALLHSRAIKYFCFRLGSTIALAKCPTLNFYDPTGENDSDSRSRMDIQYATHILPTFHQNHENSFKLSSLDIIN